MLTSFLSNIPDVQQLPELELVSLIRLIPFEVWKREFIMNWQMKSAVTVYIAAFHQTCKLVKFISIMHLLLRYNQNGLNSVKQFEANSKLKLINSDRINMKSDVKRETYHCFYYSKCFRTYRYHHLDRFLKVWIIHAVK